MPIKIPSVQVLRKTSSFVCSYEPGTLRLSNRSNTEHIFGFSLQVFRQPGPPQRGDCFGPKWEISVNCLSQGHSDALPVRESNRESATFWSLTRRSTTELSPPDFFANFTFVPCSKILLYCSRAGVVSKGLPVKIEYLNFLNPLKCE